MTIDDPTIFVEYARKDSPIKDGACERTIYGCNGWLHVACILKLTLDDDRNVIGEKQDREELVETCDGNCHATREPSLGFVTNEVSLVLEPTTTP